MNRQFIFIAVFLVATVTSSVALAQKREDNAAAVTPVVIEDPVEEVPEFPGGFDAFKKFIKANLRNVKGAAGKRVFLSFIVEKNGSLTAMKVMRGINDHADQEAIRVMKLSPKWKPTSQNGVLTRSMYTISIKFR